VRGAVECRIVEGIAVPHVVLTNTAKYLFARGYHDAVQDIAGGLLVTGPAEDLQRQLERLREYARARGYEVVSEYIDVASGLNQNRRGLDRMLRAAERGEFGRVLIEYPDRLARFGYAYLERYLGRCGVEIEVTSWQEPADAHEELVQDLLAIVTSFSARLYGPGEAGKYARDYRS